MDIRGDFIAVTHFINPQLFWFHRVDVRSEGTLKIQALEEKLALKCELTLTQEKPYSAKIDELVAARYLPWNKYIRGRVLKVDQGTGRNGLEYILWAIDHGFPIKTDARYIRKLPDDEYFNIPIEHVHRGGVANIVPAEKEFDFMEGNAVMTIKPKWSDRACEFLENQIEKAVYISFMKQFTDGNGHLWGDLMFVDRRQKNFKVADILMAISCALECQGNFRVECRMLKTTKIEQYLRNNGSVNVRANVFVTKDKNLRKNETCMFGVVGVETSTESECEYAKKKVKDWCERNNRLLQLSEKDVAEFAGKEEENEPGTSGSNLNPNKNVLSPKFSLPTSSVQEYDISEEAKILLDPNHDFSTRRRNVISIPSAQSIENVPVVNKAVSSSASSSGKTMSVRMRKLIEIKQRLEKNERDYSASECDSIGKQESEHKDAAKFSDKHDDLNVVPPKFFAAPKKPSTSTGPSLGDFYRNYVQSEDGPNIATAAKEEPTLIVNMLPRRDNISSVSAKSIQRLIAKRKAFGATQENLPDTKEKSISTVPNKYKEQLKKNASEMRMIPAGFDMFNLNKYNDSENHWHVKKSVRNDNQIDNDDSFFSEPLSNATNNLSNNNEVVDAVNAMRGLNLGNSTKDADNQNFRHTRSHMDKYKNSSSSNTNKHLLDETVSELNNTILEPIKVSATIASNVESVVLPRRKQREPPVIQKDKIHKILQSAQYEKDLGNNFILDLKHNITRKNNCNANVGTELSTDATGILDVSGSSSTDLDSSRPTTSNKRAFASKRRDLGDNKEDGSSSTDLDSSRPVTSNKRAFTAKRSELSGNKENDKQTVSSSSSNNKEAFPVLSRIDANFSNVIYTQKNMKLDGVDGLHAMKFKTFDNRVLAHAGKSVHVEENENFSDINFHQQEITDQMYNMRITKVYRIQAYGWPHILRNNSLFVVNPARSGKTWCYLPPICSLVCLRIKNFMVPETYGPVAIIMVPSSTHAEHVSKHCQRLLVKCNVKTVPLFGMRNLVKAKLALLEGCGILVTTPASLLRLLKDDDEFIDGSRLHHFVIDDVELMLSRSSKDFSAAVEAILKLSKPHKKKTLQMVATSREWKPELLSLIKTTSQPLLLIGDFLEAAAYSKAAITIKLSASDKISMILHFIEKHPSELNRLIIFCNNTTDSAAVHKALVSLGHDSVLCNRDSVATELNFIKSSTKDWPRGLIIVCEDDVFPELKIQNANNLIHYTMPATWTIFTNRFSAMKNSYANLLLDEGKTTNGNASQKPISLVLLDKENSEELPCLHDFLKKHNQLKYVNPEILNVVEAVQIRREEARRNKNFTLCPYVLEFGECDEVRCYHRHILTRFDAINESDDIPRSGELRILILKVFSPTHYAVRLLKYKPEQSTEWREIRSSSKVALFVMNLNLHYKCQESLVQHWPIHVNDLCICKVDDRYQRALVMKLGDIKNVHVIHRVQVTVKLIDLGEIKEMFSDELYVCNEKFQNFPPQAVDIRLKGVVPVDNERTWDSEATKSVHMWIKQNIDKNMCVQIKINFALAQTIWVSNVIVLKHLPSVGQYTYHINVRRSLIEKNFAVIAPTNSKHISDVAEKLGLLVINNNNDRSDDENSVLSSDLDYKSCNNDDSKLITFSNDSNDSSCSIQANTNAMRKKESPTKNLNQSSIVNDSEHEEDWDRLLEKPATDKEIYLPLLKINTDEKVPSKSSEKNSLYVDSASVRLSAAKDEWLELPLQKTVKVEIGDETENGKWSEIYLQCIDDVHQNNFNKLQELIRQYINELKNEKNFHELKPSPMQNCIVKHDGLYLRAKICGIFSDEKTECIYRFFLCDYAFFVTARKAELFNDFLYPTTKEIVEFTPYQAVHCHLAGIKLDSFARQQKVTNDYLFAYAVTESAEQSTLLKNLQIKSYDILFYECEKEHDLESAQMLNKVLVQSGCAIPDPETKHFLDLDINIDLSGFDLNNAETMLRTPNENGDVVNFETLLQCLQQSFEMDLEDYSMEGKCEDKMSKAIKEGKEIYTTALKKQTEQLKNLRPVISKNKKNNENHTNHTEIIKAKMSINMEEESLKMNESEIDGLPQTQALNKRPQTTWYQTDCVIYVVIYAPDVINYYLQVTSDTLYFAASVQGEEQAVILNLLGIVDPSQVSHEIRGLNVIVRLVKMFYVKWPRLLQQSTKYSWLKYDLNAIDKAEMDYLQPQQQLLMQIDNNKTARSWNSVSSVDDSDDEFELFENYTPIVNNDDIRDPTTDCY